MARKKQISLDTNQRDSVSLPEGTEHDVDTFVGTFAGAFVLFDENLNCISTNTAGEKLLGQSKSDVSGKNIVDIIPDSKTTGFYDLCVGVLEEDSTTFVNESVMHSKSDGVSITVKAFKVGNGLGIIAQNIIEGKQLEDLTQGAEASYQLLAENITDVIFAMDMNLNLTYLSPSIQRQQGFTVEELMSQVLGSTVTPNSLEKMANVFAEELNIEQMEQKDLSRSRTTDLEVYHKDGSTIWIEQNISFLRDEHGTAYGILGVSRDITERKQVEMKVKESEEKYRLLAENATDVIFTMDMDLQLTYVSPSIKRQQGYTVDEVITLKIKDAMTPDSVETLRKTLTDELALVKKGQSDSSRSQTVELEVYCQDGSSLWTEQTIAFLHNQQGQPYGLLGVSRDISERKQVEKALSDSEAEFTVLVENLADAVFRFKDGVITWGNDKIEEMLGYSKEEFVGTDVNIFMPSDDNLPEIYKSVGAELKKHGHFHGFTRVKRRDGTVADVEYTASPVPGKIPVELVGVARDVTERIQARHVLEQNEEYLRALIDNALDAFVILNGDGTIRYKSPANERMLGYSSEEREDGGILEHIHPDDMARVANDFSDIFKTPGSKIHTEIRCQHRDGHWLSVEAVGKNLLDNPAVNSIVVHMRDITESKKAANELERRSKQILALQEVTASIQSTQDLKEILQIVTEAAVINLGFDHSLLFLRDEDEDINRATVFFTSASSGFISEIEETISRALTEVEVPVGKGYNSVMDDCLEGKETIAHSFYEMVGLLLDKEKCDAIQVLTGAKTIVHIPFFAGEEFAGGIAALTMREHVVDEDLEPLRLLADHAGIAIDNYRLNKDLEQRVVDRTKQLEAANSELESFSYSVSHDLRAPLRSIDGFSNMLLEDYNDVLDEQGKDYLRRIDSNIGRMTQLIDGILEMSKLTRGDINNQSVDLSDLVRSISEELQQQQPERKAEFNITSGLVVKGDARLLGAVLENLISNAWKFTSKRDVASIELGCEEINDQPTFYVRDNGAGFDMANIDRLFGTFQRLHTSEEFEGTGIGLATVKRIINRHGGEVWAESAIDQGATFYFTL